MEIGARLRQLISLPLLQTGLESICLQHVHVFMHGTSCRISKFLVPVIMLVVLDGRLCVYSILLNINEVAGSLL